MQVFYAGSLVNAKWNCYTDKGLATITYPSGHTDHLDVAVRRAVLTGIGQTAGKIGEARADEMGCDLVETSAHAGARTGEGIKNHAGWQGKIFSRSGTHKDYPDFVSSTGYGNDAGDGLHGWNCRHDFSPFFEGISAAPANSDEYLEKLRNSHVTLDGEEVPLYEATQKQRSMERHIRKWKRQAAALEAAGKPADAAKAKVKQWQEKMRDFVKQTGLPRDYFRERTGTKPTKRT